MVRLKTYPAEKQAWRAARRHARARRRRAAGGAGGGAVFERQGFDHDPGVSDLPLDIEISIAANVEGEPPALFVANDGAVETHRKCNDGDPRGSVSLATARVTEFSVAPAPQASTAWPKTAIAAPRAASAPYPAARPRAPARHAPAAAMADCSA